MAQRHGDLEAIAMALLVRGSARGSDAPAWSLDERMIAFK
jgi:hypothetical protein